jgi:hypothetical protein
LSGRSRSRTAGAATGTDSITADMLRIVPRRA